MVIARTKVSERKVVRVRPLDDEFLVEVLVFGRVEERKTYFTNSKDDALATYSDVVRRERLAESCATCDGSGEDPVGMPGEPCPDCEPDASEATSPSGWRAPEAEVLAVESGMREGRK